VKDQGVEANVKLGDISKLSSDAITQAVVIKQKVDVLEQHAESVAENISREERESIIGWISPADITHNHEAARHRYEDGTCRWLLNESPYVNWKTSAQPLCWLNGKVGCGKTILCSTVIEDLKKFVTTDKDSKTQLIYFYFSFSDTQRQSLHSLLRSAVAQLCHLKPILDRLKQMKASSFADGPSLQDLKKTLELALEENNLFLVVDALDEIPEYGDQRRDVLDWINGTVAAAGDRINIFATSRAEHDIKTTMVDSDAVQIDIHRAIVDADIRRYVSNELRRDKRLCDLSNDVKLCIEQELSTRADGM
jgi:hypothetical protein